ncbi:hypothetical protein JRQ81_014103 [Phrynocephalus forsythii]|uniref:Reverse transcriptase n=1 Tax=Phrynocephalus forsythii TaxID=171643 RepID=A0A9Q0XW34_9SAUR|nr:hypothetical protein JRQ81_014103 [Phrynocephalus forsythii]
MAHQWNTEKTDRSPDFAAEEEAIRTNAVKARIEKSTESPTCRLCKEADETIDHILSCCKKIAQTDYKQPHNVVAQVVHWNLCQNYHLPVANNWWDHKPEKVTEIQVVPVAIGTLGTVPKELSKYLEEIGVDKVTISQLQKAALLGSARIIRRYIT